MWKFFLLQSIFVSHLFSFVYEDAEDTSVKRWTLASPQHQGTIENLFDESKNSRIIKLQGEGTKSIYQLALPATLENIQMDNSFLTWEMKYVEDFVILIVFDTTKGKRQLVYTSGERNSYLQYGLRHPFVKKWKKYSRNLEKDLQIYEKDNKIIELQYFVIKGSGSIDNILLKRVNDTKDSSVEKKKAAKPLVPAKDYTNDILPVIELKGENPLLLKVGEAYIEAGASAKNRDGSEIEMKITDNIDILTEGEYTVIYIATNKLGNSSIDKRQVIVGDKASDAKESCKEVLIKCKENSLFEEEPLEEEEELPKFMYQGSGITPPKIEEVAREKEVLDLPARPGL